MSISANPLTRINPNESDEIKRFKQRYSRFRHNTEKTTLERAHFGQFSPCLVSDAMREKTNFTMPTLLRRTRSGKKIRAIKAKA